MVKDSKPGFGQIHARRVYLHPPGERQQNEEVLRGQAFEVSRVPEGIRELAPLLDWIRSLHGAVAMLTPVGWMAIDAADAADQALPEVFDLHISGVDEWGSSRARRMSPSRITNAVALQLQGQDPETGEQEEYSTPAFLNYRPAFATPGLPLTLAHPAFGRFKDIFQGHSQERPRPDDFNFFLQLSFVCSRYYTQEADYVDKVSALWGGYATVDFIRGDEHHFGCRHFMSRSLYGVLEAKQQMDPTTMQAPQYYRHYWLKKGNRKRFRNSCFPALLIEHAGPCLRVSAAAVLSKVSVVPLTPWINLLMLQGHDVNAAEQGVRLCLAVKHALQELSAFYRGFSDGPSREHFFLKDVPYPLHQMNPDFKRLGYKLVYLVMAPDTSSAMVVKIVDRPYGESVHRAWAAAGLAPRLHQVTRLDGGWYQVSMEYLGSGWTLLQDCSKPEELRPQVLKALEKAHKLPCGNSVGVHGDMRDSNVMVKLDGDGAAQEIRFIDFDWAREQGASDANYPSFMNHFGISWPAGVGTGEAMLQKHDMELLSMPQKLQARRREETSW